MAFVFNPAAISPDVQYALDLKVPVESPALTGNPTAPTPATSDNDTSIATTAFVKAQLLAVIYPVGCYYTQYPDASSNTEATEFPTSQRPATMFGGTWVEQWSAESVFFRTRGTLSDSERTTGKQEDQMQQITGSITGNINGDVAGVANTGTGALSGGTVLNKQAPANPITGYGIGIINFNSNNSSGARTGTDTRSVNRRIKVYKRTA